MIEYVLAPVPALFFAALSYFLYRLFQDGDEAYWIEKQLYENPNAEIFMATITGEVHDDSTYFKIVFEDHGQRLQGRTDYYYKIWRKYNVGDVIPIKYYKNKSGIVMALIMNDEDESERRSSYSPKVTKAFLGITIGCLGIAVYCIIRAIVAFLVV